MDIMSLIWFVAILCIIGVILWGGSRLIAKVPMPDFVRIIITVVVVIFCILVVVNYFPVGLIPSGHGRLR